MMEMSLDLFSLLGAGGGGLRAHIEIKRQLASQFSPSTMRVPGNRLRLSKVNLTLTKPPTLDSFCNNYEETFSYV